MRKTIIWMFFGLCNVIQAYSQGSSNFLNPAPDFLNITTPNAASFTKFIDNPINLYHGTPDVSVPIDTLKDGDVELPI